MATITELAAEILSSQASTTAMTTDELLASLQKIHATLKALEAGETVSSPTEEPKPTISAKSSIKANEIICLICGKGKMKTLTRHLTTAHQMSAKEYKQQFGIAAKQSLSAKNLTESRKAGALARGTGDNLAKARAVRAANIAEGKSNPKAKAKPKAKAVKTK